MIPLKISLSGFMSYRDQQTMIFDGATLWVLCGPNGAGKSAVFDAITFVLFGIYRDQKQNYVDLINHGCDRAVVTYDFRLGDTIYRVQRTIHRRGAATRCAYILNPSRDGGDLQPEPIQDTDREVGFKEWVEHKVGLNYETFTASVLLQQGKSDRLLDSGTEQRYKILSKLIDLSRYEELEARAKDRRRYWKERVTYYDGQLGNIPSVLDKDLLAAQERIRRTEDANRVAAAKVNELTELFGEAQRWETLNGQLKIAKGELEQARQLIHRETEIDQYYRRWSDLNSVLPILNNIYINQIRLAESKRLEEQCQRKYEETLAPLRGAEQREGELAQKYRQQGEIVDACRKSIQSESDRMSELKQTITLLDQIEADQMESNKYQNQLSEFPEDLHEQYVQAQEREAHLSEAERAIFVLRSLYENRTKLLDAVERRNKAIKDHESASRELEKALQKLKEAEEGLERARQTDSDARAAEVKAKTRLEEVQAREERFSQVEGEKVCRYCGNEMTPEHVEKEKETIHKELLDAEQNLKTAKREGKACLEVLKKAENALKTARVGVSGQEKVVRDHQVTKHTTEREISGYLSTLKSAYTGLPDRFRKLVSLEMPGDVNGWLTTEYPGQSDIDQVQKDSDQARVQRAAVEQLRARIEKYNQISTLIEMVERRLEQNRLKLPESWENARSEYEAASKRREQAQKELLLAQRLYESLRHEQEAARKKIDELRQNQNEANTRVKAEQVRQSEIEANLHNLEKQLTSPEWQAIASNLTQADLDTLQTEFNNLSEYDGLHRDLSVTKQSVQEKERKVVDLETEITDIPKEARRRAADVQTELAQARAISQAADRERQQAEQDYMALVERKADRDVIEKKKGNAERKAYLYGILEEQMSDRGIQQALINQAEVAIVNEANQSLYNLSAGRWTLALRERGRNKKALDLEVRDHLTGGQEAIPIVLTSGSQRFRIAVSLALSIGKYIRRESRRIESVIIDEGFGSLDKTGREDAIQELRALQQHLERIILVSHQEEFYQTFQTGYTVNIINGSSQVSVLEN